MASRPSPERRGTSSRGRSGKRPPENRYRRSSRTPGRGNAGASYRKGGKSAHPGILIAALVAVVLLVGLIYWGKSSKPAPAPAPRPAPAAREQGHSDRKAFDHRESPRSKDVARSRTGENSSSHQSPALVEKRTSELHGPATPEQAPNSNTLVPSSGHHYASRMSEHGSSELPKPPPPKPAPPAMTPPVARVAIVIDDFGADLGMARRFIELPIPITISILPYQRYSRDIADLAHVHHRQVILHLPMEPQGYPRVNPGKGALLVSRSVSAIQNSVSSALDSSPYFAGINNHMGSRFTENAALMRTVLEEAQKRGLYFIDSYTSPHSVVSSVAQQVHIPFRRRDIFLDNNPSGDAVREQLRQLIRRAKIQGSALGIGHPRESTLRALVQIEDEFRREEIAVVPAGELMTGY